MPSSPSTPSPKSLTFAEAAVSAPSPVTAALKIVPAVFCPKLAFAGGNGRSDGRRTSVQFASHNDAGQRAASPKPHPPLAQRRMSSPPPPSNYENRVSFDTFDNRDATDLSFTLISKHKDYVYTPRSRTFLCGADQNDYSEFALDWLIDELVEDGDEIVCLRVLDKDSKINSESNLQEGKYRTEARNLLDHIQNKNKEDAKSISLVLEFAVGKVAETIQRMITIYSPACLIVGTRGRSLGGIQGLLPGSVSKYCLQTSPVPVVVVRPSAKREKKKRKRLADPSRRAYMNILERSGVAGSQSLDKTERDRLVTQPEGEASEKEAEAVAKAIGLSEDMGTTAGSVKDSIAEEDGGPLAKIASLKSDYTSGPESPSPIEVLNPFGSVPGESKGPELEGIDSPTTSDVEDDDEDEEEKSPKGGKTTSVDKARKMEAGEGKFLKPESCIPDEP